MIILSTTILFIIFVGYLLIYFNTINFRVQTNTIIIFLLIRFLILFI